MESERSDLSLRLIFDVIVERGYSSLNYKTLSKIRATGARAGLFPVKAERGKPVQEAVSYARCAALVSVKSQKEYFFFKRV